MADIYVYGEIGSDFNGMSARTFADELKNAGGAPVTVHINSGGGNAFDANTMAELLRSYSGETTAKIEGMAASAASYFALTANRVTISENALMMIHNPWCCSCGTAEDLRTDAEFLDNVCVTIVNQYAKKSGRDAKEIQKLMDAETWFTAQEAVDFGFADDMGEALDVAASTYGRDHFKNAPKSLFSDEKKKSEQKPETHPRDEKKPLGEGDSTIETVSNAGAVCLHGLFLKGNTDSKE